MTRRELVDYCLSLPLAYEDYPFDGIVDAGAWTVMETDTFEKAFIAFLDRREYDEANSALFDMVRISFKAGWQAAGGDPPSPQPVLQLVPNNPQNLNT